MMQSWLDAVLVYRDRRLAAILAMGFLSGLPLALSGATLSFWLAQEGVSKTAIGLFAMIAAPYTFKFVWAPVFDQIPPPGLSRFGRRRGWLVILQITMAAALLALGSSDPSVIPLWTAIAAFTVAFVSASQDIVIDAYRIDVLDDDEQGAGAAATQLGYRIGMLVSGAGALALSDHVSWFWVYAAMAAVTPLGLMIVLWSPRAGDAVPVDGPLNPAARLRAAFIDPLVDFMRHGGWVAILAFVLFYKFGDAIGGVMANPFYVELGFTGTEVAAVTKVFGTLATVAGILTGGVLVARYGVIRALVIGGILQAATNLTFAWLAWTGKDVGILAVAIGADNFTGGLGSAAFVAYLSSLCNAKFTGTQYALLTSFMAFGRTVLSSGGGWLADQTDWVTFFIATTALALPGLLLLWFISRQTRSTLSPPVPTD